MRYFARSPTRCPLRTCMILHDVIRCLNKYIVAYHFHEHHMYQSSDVASVMPVPRSRLIMSKYLNNYLSLTFWKKTSQFYVWIIDIDFFDYSTFYNITQLIFSLVTMEQLTVSCHRYTLSITIYLPNWSLLMMLWLCYIGINWGK